MLDVYLRPKINLLLLLSNSFNSEHLAKRSAVKCSAEDEMNRESKYVSEFLTKFSPGAKGPYQL